MNGAERSRSVAYEKRKKNPPVVYRTITNLEEWKALLATEELVAQVNPKLIPIFQALFDPESKQLLYVGSNELLEDTGSEYYSADAYSVRLQVKRLISILRKRGAPFSIEARATSRKRILYFLQPLRTFPEQASSVPQKSWYEEVYTELLIQGKNRVYLALVNYTLSVLLSRQNGLPETSTQIDIVSPIISAWADFLVSAYLKMDKVFFYQDSATQLDLKRVFFQGFHNELEATLRTVNHDLKLKHANDFSPLGVSLMKQKVLNHIKKEFPLIDTSIF